MNFREKNVPDNSFRSPGVTICVHKVVRVIFKKDRQSDNMAFPVERF